MPARVNLSSALIIKGEYSKAIGFLEEALKLKKDDPSGLNNLAVARYLDALNASSGVKMSENRREVLKNLMAEESVDSLRKLVREHENFPDAYYNLARILTELGENTEPENLWKTFLNLEPAGIYAHRIRERIGLAVSEAPKVQARGFGKNMRVSLGAFDETSEKQLANIPKHSFKLEKVSGDFYSGKDFRVLVLEGEVELVESAVKEQNSQADIVSMYGQPDRMFTAISGKKILVYENFAVDIKDDIATTVVYFNKNQI